MVLWRPTRPSKINTLKRYPFHYRGLECKRTKSRDTWTNRQIWPWSTKGSRSKANRVLPRECIGHSKHPLPTTQEKLYICTSPDGQYQNQINYILCSRRWRSSIQSAPSLVFADCIQLPFLAAKNRVILISVLTIWWCPCVESSPVLLEEGVCYDQPVCSLGKILLAFALLHFVLQDQTCLLLQVMSWDRKSTRLNSSHAL